jgi:hypothetical protein
MPGPAWAFGLSSKSPILKFWLEPGPDPCIAEAQKRISTRSHLSSPLILIRKLLSDARKEKKSLKTFFSFLLAGRFKKRGPMLQN